MQRLLRLVALFLFFLSSFFFFNDTATTEIYTLSLHDALPISLEVAPMGPGLKVWCDSWADNRDLRPAALQFGDFILGDGTAAEYQAFLAGQI